MLERVQRVAGVVAAGAALLGVAAGAGCSPLPAGPSAAAWGLHPLLLLLGLLAGYATILRKEEIDQKRWEIVHDAALTRGERELAHREAEAQIRIAGTLFLLAPVALGFWLANQFYTPARFTPADLLIITPLLGYLAGLLAGLRRHSRPRA